MQETNKTKHDFRKAKLRPYKADHKKEAGNLKRFEKKKKSEVS